LNASQQKKVDDYKTWKIGSEDMDRTKSHDALKLSLTAPPHINYSNEKMLVAVVESLKESL
jgi:hypothetical protein